MSWSHWPSTPDPRATASGRSREGPKFLGWVRTTSRPRLLCCNRRGNTRPAWHHRCNVRRGWVGLRCEGRAWPHRTGTRTGRGGSILRWWGHRLGWARWECRSRVYRRYIGVLVEQFRHGSWVCPKPSPPLSENKRFTVYQGTRSGLKKKDIRGRNLHIPSAWQVPCSGCMKQSRRCWHQSSLGLGCRCWLRSNPGPSIAGSRIIKRIGCTARGQDFGSNVWQSQCSGWKRRDDGRFREHGGRVGGRWEISKWWL